MPIVFFVLACLASVSHGRRLRTKAQQHPSRPTAELQNAFRAADSNLIARAVAEILQACMPAAFAVPFSGKGFRASNPARSGSRNRCILLQQDNSTVILDGPAPADVPYKLDKPKILFFGQWRQDQYLWPTVLQPITQYYEKDQGDDGQQQRPFFVESGARDGEEHSNTLYLEREQGWNGILIEPSVKEYPLLLKKKRKCYSWQGCLSPTGKRGKVQFLDTGDGLSKIDNGEGRFAAFSSNRPIIETVKAESLLSLLQAIDKESGSHTVDFWSLDIEGSEGPVLETTDFQAIEFGVLMIEMNKGVVNNKRIRKVMEANNFVEIGGTLYDDGILDYVFVNPKYFAARGIPIPEQVDGLTPPSSQL